MRKHFYLVVENERHEDREGGVTIFDNRLTPSEKNSQTVHHKRDLETGETWNATYVSLGYYDFEDEDEYVENGVEIIEEKLAEIDEQHLIDSGVEPEEVLN